MQVSYVVVVGSKYLLVALDLYTHQMLEIELPFSNPFRNQILKPATCNRLYNIFSHVSKKTEGQLAPPP